MSPARTLLAALALVLLACGAARAQEAAAPPPPEGAEQARALAQMLRDPAARDALIARLEEVAAGTAGVQAAPQEPAPGLVNEVARRSKQAAERLAAIAGSATGAVVAVRGLFTGEAGDVVGGSLAVARDLALLVVVTLALFALLRWLANRLYAGLARRASGAGWLRTLSLLVASSSIDAVTAVGAWAGGYGLALALGATGSVDVAQTLFLNAFLLIELTKVALRAVLVPRYGELRLLPMGDETASYWSFWASRLVSLLGYGLLLVVPLVRERVTDGAGTALAVLVALTALVMAVVVILQNRRPVRAVLTARAARASWRIERALLDALARTWHGIAIVYVLALFAMWAADPVAGVRWMAAASAQSLVAVALGAAVVGFISRWVAGGIHVPDDVRERLPLLEQRLNAYVPAILGVVRLAVLACVAIALAQIWGLLDFLAWVQQEAGREALMRILSAFLIAVLAVAVYVGMSSWVEYRLNPNFGTAPTARERTLLALLRNAFTIALVVLASMLVLAQLGMNIAPLLAGAGVLGLAIGFGAQKLVQDVITGAFIQLENVMNEGDVVTVGGITGVVERLTIRSVGLRDLNGVYHVIPFSSADSVSNFMKGFSYHVAEIGVAYRENVAEVKALMQEAFDRLQQGEHGPNLIAPLEMHGVTRFADSAVVVRARLKTLPGTQWAAGRAYNEIIKEIFDERGVEIPFPHVTLYMGEDKQGNAPPLRIAGRAGDGGGIDSGIDGSSAPSPA